MIWPWTPWVLKLETLRTPETRRKILWLLLAWGVGAAMGFGVGMW
jgi:hypothetical protein